MTLAAPLRTPLLDVGVLVTRPVELAGRMMQRLGELGAQPFLYPTLVLVAPPPSASLAARLAAIKNYDWLLFVSPSAVQFGLAALRQAVPAIDLQQLPAAAVGGGTATALYAAGVQNVLVPQHGSDSEHLLALPPLADLTGQRVLIVRGDGGRELISETLRARGAVVEYAECYQRAAPQSDPAPLRQAFTQQRIRAITVLSGGTLDNLLALLDAPSAALARALPLFVPHPRIAEHARAQGFAEVVTTEAGDEGMLSGLVEYFAHA